MRISRDIRLIFISSLPRRVASPAFDTIIFGGWTTIERFFKMIHALGRPRHERYNARATRISAHHYIHDEITVIA